MSRARFVWNDAELEALRALVAEGLSDNHIALVMGAGVDGVRAHRKRLRMERSVMVGWWTAARDKTLTDLFDGEASDAEIATAMDISERSVKRRRHHLELHRAPGPDRNAQAEDWLSRDEAFIRRLLSDGGMPRALATPKGTVWLGADNRPWFDPDRRRIAA